MLNIAYIYTYTLYSVYGPASLVAEIMYRGLTAGVGSGQMSLLQKSMARKVLDRHLRSDVHSLRVPWLELHSPAPLQVAHLLSSMSLSYFVYNTADTSL